MRVDPSDMVCLLGGLATIGGIAFMQSSQGRARMGAVDESSCSSAKIARTTDTISARVASQELPEGETVSDEFDAFFAGHKPRTGQPRFQPVQEKLQIQTTGKNMLGVSVIHAINCSTQPFKPKIQGDGCMIFGASEEYTQQLMNQQSGADAQEAEDREEYASAVANLPF